MGNMGFKLKLPKFHLDIGQLFSKPLKFVTKPIRAITGFALAPISSKWASKLGGDVIKAQAYKSTQQIGRGIAVAGAVVVAAPIVAAGVSTIATTTAGLTSTLVSKLGITKLLSGPLLTGSLKEKAKGGVKDLAEKVIKDTIEGKPQQPYRELAQPYQNELTPDEYAQLVYASQQSAQVVAKEQGFQMPKMAGVDMETLKKVLPIASGLLLIGLIFSASKRPQPYRKRYGR